MKTYTLLPGKYSPKCWVQITGNSFGDQILSYQYETQNGETFQKTDSNPEGNHISTIQMKKDAKSFFSEVWGK
jgi:hypothetical protein